MNIQITNKKNFVMVYIEGRTFNRLRCYTKRDNSKIGDMKKKTTSPIDTFIKEFKSNQPFREQVRDYLFDGYGREFKEIQNEIDLIREASKHG